MAKQTPGMDSLLELDNVSLVYRAMPALCDLQWSIEPGQQWACLGPNGSGKTSPGQNHQPTNQSFSQAR